MNTILYFIRDNLVGTHYFIYAFILYFLMFAIIGYLFKENYGKLDVKLATSKDDAKNKAFYEANARINNKQSGSVVKTTVDKTSTIAVNSLSNVGTVLVQKKETIISPTKKVTSPKAMPNKTTTPPVAKVMPNEEEKNIPATQITQGPVKPDLSSAIPEIK